MALKGTSFGKDDIAAMEVVADRQGSFKHKLNLARIDVHWILDVERRAVKGPRPCTPSNPPPPSTLGEISAIEASQTEENTTTGEQKDPQHSAAADGTVESLSQSPERTEHGEEPRTARSDTNSTTTFATSTTSIRRGQKKFDFLPPPKEFRTVETINRHQIVDSNPEPLITSPRSAFVILKNGFSLPELCGVPLQEYYNTALLDGVTLETVKMRVAAEEERREKKFAALVKVYHTLCGSVSREELVDAIRTHKFAEELHRQEDEERLQSISHYAHPGKFDLTVLDSDCVEVLQRSRNRTMQEIRRGLDQRDRLLRQSIERENAVLQRECQAQTESTKVQAEHTKVRQQKAEVQRERRQEVEKRVGKLLKSQKELTELRRQALMQQQEHQEERVKEKKALEKCASAALTEERERRRKQVREENAAMLEDRRSELVAKAELQLRMHEREQELKHKRKHEYNLQRQEISEKRRETIRELAEKQTTERLDKVRRLEVEAESRTKEFVRRRELRHIGKRQRAAQRTGRSAMIRDQGERIKQHRMEELEAEYAEKLKGIEQAQLEKKERTLLAKEMSAQVQLEKWEEKDRAAKADEFSKVAYVSSSNAKQRWMERANEKRVVLASQVRQEREAMVRAKDQVYLEMEQSEIQRRKKASSAMLMYSVS